MTNLSIEKHPKRQRAPIAPPEPIKQEVYEGEEDLQVTMSEEMPAKQSDTRAMNRPHRDRNFWAFVQTEEDQAALKPFKTKAALRSWLMEKEGRQLLSNSIVWGWSIEAKTVQTVAF